MSPSSCRVAVFCSGSGTNLQALLNAEKKGSLKANIELVFCDKPQAYAIERAKKAKKQVLVLEPKNYKTREEFEEALIKALRPYKIDLVVLAGFMRILTPLFIREYEGRIMNIHPSLLPAFQGAHAIADALAYGVKRAGVTVHFATAELDNGPIILQEAVEVKSSDTLESLSERIHRVEHKLYPEAVKLFAQKKLKINSRKVIN